MGQLIGLSQHRLAEKMEKLISAGNEADLEETGRKKTSANYCMLSVLFKQTPMITTWIPPSKFIKDINMMEIKKLTTE